jgi:hypothetical protein
MGWYEYDPEGYERTFFRDRAPSISRQSFEELCPGLSRDPDSVVTQLGRGAFYRFLFAQQEIVRAVELHQWLHDDPEDSPVIDIETEEEMRTAMYAWHYFRVLQGEADLVATLDDTDDRAARIHQAIEHRKEKQLAEIDFLAGNRKIDSSTLKPDEAQMLRSFVSEVATVLALECGPGFNMHFIIPQTPEETRQY